MTTLQGKSCGPYLSASAMRFMKRRYANVRPLRFFFTFKVALIAFDCVRGSGPAYFTDIFIPVADISSRSMETWLRHGPELRSVGGASTLQHQSSGMPSLSTSAQHPSVEDNSELC